MKRYWDYTRKERAAMTMETVEGLLDAELMNAGVLKIAQPVLLPTESVEVPAKDIWGIKAGYSEIHQFGFRTAEDAATAMAVMIPLGSEYFSGTSFVVEKSSGDELTITKFKVYSKQDVLNSKAERERIASNIAANKRAMDDYNKACEAVRNVTDGVWEDWRSCGSDANENNRIVSTFRSYRTMSDGNAAIARSFLVKAFSEESIAECEEWYGMKLEEMAEGE